MHRLLLALLPALLVAGCYGAYVEDHRTRFPVVVARDAPVLLLSFPSGGSQLAAEETARLDAFLAGYRERNSGPLRVTAQRAAEFDRLAIERLVAVERRAVAAGIPKEQVEVGLADGRTPVANVVLAYERYVAQVPECGDWTKLTTIDRTNTPSSNFGCASQRYLGLMASDPQDLLRARSPSLAHDPGKITDTFTKYRAGQPTPAIVGPTQSLTFGSGGPSGGSQ
jgi:pilus assembly protein CpaD